MPNGFGMSSAVSPQPAVLIDALPTKGAVRTGFLVTGYALAIGLSAQVAVPLPFTPVPITGQTFAVLLGAVVLGSGRALAGSLLYLTAGVAGFPWFASAGGATFGYVIGFVAAATLVGLIAERGNVRHPLAVAGVMGLGNAVIYAVGVVYLAKALGIGLFEAVKLGLVPFLLGDAFKVALATVLVPVAWRLVDRGHHPGVGG